MSHLASSSNSLSPSLFLSSFFIRIPSPPSWFSLLHLHFYFPPPFLSPSLPLLPNPFFFYSVRCLKKKFHPSSFSPLPSQLLLFIPLFSLHIYLLPVCLFPISFFNLHLSFSTFHSFSSSSLVFCSSFFLLQTLTKGEKEHGYSSLQPLVCLTAFIFLSLPQNNQSFSFSLFYIYIYLRPLSLLSAQQAVIFPAGRWQTAISNSLSLSPGVLRGKYSHRHHR